MHCMLMDLLHGFEVLSTTEETLFNSQFQVILTGHEVLRVRLSDEVSYIMIYFNAFTMTQSAKGLIKLASCSHVQWEFNE